MVEIGQGVLDAIRARRSIRHFLEDPVKDEDVRVILEAGRWAPSGLNNQPWRFAVVRNREVKEEIARQTRYRDIISSAPVIVAVFIDNAVGYDRVKDCQSIGACLQNMWLATHTLNLGGVWLGEILKNKDRVAEILETPETYELMAVMAIGHPRSRQQQSQRKPLADLIFKEI